MPTSLTKSLWEAEREKSEAAANAYLTTNGLKVLTQMGPAISKRDRIAHFMKEIAPPKAQTAHVRDVVSTFVDAYNNYVLVRDQAQAVYLREIRTDSYGKLDKRKAVDAMWRLLKREALDQGNSNWPNRKVYWCVTLASQEVGKAGERVSTSLDKGVDYERRCLAELLKVSTDPHLTTEGADFGADIIFTVDGVKCVAQCKAHAKPVGVKAIQEVVAAKRHYSASFAAVFSESGFSDQASDLATSNRVALAVGRDVAGMMRQFHFFRST